MTLAALAAGTALIASVGSTAASAKPGEQGKPLPRRMRVQDAVTTLGAGADTIARGKGSSASEWKHLAHDSSAWVDAEGALYYVEPVRPEATAVAADASTTAAAAIPADQTFLLHSNPNSTRKLYLDFDGHTATGTAWSAGTIVAPPFSVDADPAFSADEILRIQDAWKIVAEDYAPFDIDVTTQDPGYAGINRASGSDLAFGTRIVMTRDSGVAAAVCPNGCGGIAYVGVIDTTGATHDYYQPAFVFNSSVKGLAEAISHEAGHNMGLSHDGTATVGYYSGHGAWAPIMGTSYTRPLGQWSRGEYAGANNTQDDFAVVTGNAVPLRPDTVGSLDSPSDIGTSPVSISGHIGPNNDTDAYRFTTAGGTVGFWAVPSSYGANLDIRLTIVDAAGTAIAASDPPVTMVDAITATGLDASVSATVPAGTYRVIVDGVGALDPLSTGYSDYGSVGPFTLAGSFPTSSNVVPTAAASVSATSGTAPLTVTYSSAGSADADGTIAAYQWTFADGTTSAAPNPSKTYSVAGTYAATLRVTDNVGAVSAPASVNVTVQAPAATSIKVQSMTITRVVSSRQTSARTVVTVTDSSGAPVSGVTVTGNYTGSASSSPSGVTDSTGKVTLTSRTTRNRTGSFTFTVSNLTKAGTVYASASNLISSIRLTF